MHRLQLHRNFDWVLYPKLCVGRQLITNKTKLHITLFLHGGRKHRTPTISQNPNTTLTKHSRDDGQTMKCQNISDKYCQRIDEHSNTHTGHIRDRAVTNHTLTKHKTLTWFVRRIGDRTNKNPNASSTFICRSVFFFFHFFGASKVHMESLAFALERVCMQNCTLISAPRVDQNVHDVLRRDDLGMIHIAPLRISTAHRDKLEYRNS